MMEVVLPRSYREEFAFAAAMKREDILYREKIARFESRQRQMTDAQRIADRQKDAQAWAMLETALASPAQVKAFRVDLDRYDTKTVEALMDNQEAMEAVRGRIDDMLGKAAVLPDGRRVFKTMDGQRVFDEHGQALSRDLIDPASIDDKKPKWETFSGEKGKWQSLNEERKALLDYQAKLDDARARLDKGEITEQELSETKADLTATMPDAVREKLGIEKPKADVAPAAPSPLDGMDALMQQTGLGAVQTASPTCTDRPSAPTPF